jgi:hypothetical protein
MVLEAEHYDDPSDRYGASLHHGSSVWAFATPTEALQAAYQSLESEGWTLDREQAKADAIAETKARHEAKQKASDDTVFRCKNNGSQRGARQWRLLRDGTVERTSRTSIYRKMPVRETPPKELIDFALSNGIELK